MFAGKKLLASCLALGLSAIGASAGTVIDSESGPGGHKYELVLDSQSTWDQAASAARAKGGFLATLGDASEQAVIEQMLTQGGAPSGSYWFGLIEHGGEGNYVHLSGLTPTVNHFLPTQPDNNGLGESRGSVLWTAGTGATTPRNGFWNDLPNQGGYPIVAKIYPDLVSKGYFIEYPGANPTFNNGDGDNLLASGGQGPTPIPLPGALLLTPAGLALAAYAARRMRKTQVA
jgi:hypothetical protein